MLDSSVATVRRRMRDDPMFPRPFRLSEEADLMWVLTDIEAYVAAKAAKARAA